MSQLTDKELADLRFRTQIGFDMRVKPATMQALLARLDTAESALAEVIERVRDIHHSTPAAFDSPNGPDEYCGDCGAPWPCPTVQALLPLEVADA